MGRRGISYKKKLEAVEKLKRGKVSQDSIRLYLSAIPGLKDKGVVSFAMGRNNNNQLV